MFNSIHTRYNDLKTKRNHEINVDERNSKITIWLLNDTKVGEEPRHIGIAQITKDKNDIRVGWFEKDQHEPSSFSYFKELQEAFDVIDERINQY